MIKIGDKVITTQDSDTPYQATVTEIKRMAHPHRSDDKIFTFYRLEGKVRNVTKNFLTHGLVEMDLDYLD